MSLKSFCPVSFSHFDHDVFNIILPGNETTILGGIFKPFSFNISFISFILFKLMSDGNVFEHSIIYDGKFGSICTEAGVGVGNFITPA